MDEQLKTLAEKARSLPLSPGVYIMKDKSGKIIYIGKAKALKKRVSQYFGSQNKHTEKTRQMVALVKDFDYIVCDSEFEALILECSLIKQNNPKYNILLKDDKGYHYIHITGGDWPKISAARKETGDGKYIGPYASSDAVRDSIEEANKIFKLPSCSKVFPRDIRSGRPCLYHFIGQCSAPCAGKIKQGEYQDAVNGALDFLQHGTAATQKKLQTEMEAAAENLEFERAAKLRDRMNAIKKITEKQKVVASKIPEQDIVALVEGSKQACFEVFRFVNGRLQTREHFFIEKPDSAMTARSEFLIQYYSIRDRIPPRITIDGPVQDSGLITEWLKQKLGKKVVLSQPQKGEQLALVEMCRNNAAERIAQKEGMTGKLSGALDELARLTGLKNIPAYIEAYDISNTAGTDNVAAMIVYENGKPLKAAYRKFIIKGFEGQDDYRSMAEVMERRLCEYEIHKGEEKGFGKLPDLILLDGGLGQVNAVLPVLAMKNISVPVFGMVKDTKHRSRALVSPEGEIAIKATRSVFTLVTNIQDEVHRFAIGFHQNRRKKRTFAPTLQIIEGVGETRAKILLKHFGSVKAIAAADKDELSRVKGITKEIAENIYSAFHQE